MAKFTYIDLFAGIGGFHLALESIGGTCCGFSEIAPDAIKAYCTNYNITEEHNFGDITKLTSLPKHDFMTAGVPCQSWSIAGKNLGFDDDRGQLWNDTLFLLNESRPKTFIFENVKGLTDPRNKKALDYILDRIAQAGYYAQPFVLNAYDYGVPQTRVRIYIVGFKEKKYLDRLVIPSPAPGSVQLGDILDDYDLCDRNNSNTKSRWSLSCNEQGFNDYFLFNDLRNGHTTIHSWDIIPTTDRQKYICYMLLQNRRKSIYGILDGNAMALNHFRQIDPSIQLCEIEDLVAMGILKTCPYKYVITGDTSCLPEDDRFLLSLARCGTIIVDELKIKKERSISSTRGNIYDCNGKVLAYNELSHSVTIEDVYESGSQKNTQLNATLKEVLNILWENGDDVSYDFHIYIDENGDFAFDVSGTRLLRFLADVYGYATIDKLSEREKNATADQVIYDLAASDSFGIGSRTDPEDSKSFQVGLGYTKQELLDLTAIRYTMRTTSYQKYIPVTIATDVSEESVAKIQENLEDLDGIEIAEDTIRKYPDGIIYEFDTLDDLCAFDPSYEQIRSSLR